MRRKVLAEMYNSLRRERALICLVFLVFVSDGTLTVESLIHTEWHVGGHSSPYS